MLAIACSDSPSAIDGAEDGVSGETEEAAEGGETQAIGSCDYASPFTGADECREFVGDGWTEADVQAACGQLDGASAMGEACAQGERLGRCILDEATPNELHIIVYGSDSSTCATQQMGCEVFGGGRWDPQDNCQGDEPATDPPQGGSVFIPPTLECRDPLPGEPEGQGPDGQVCTWQAISASTEEGRHFEDYASCEVVYSQRPYYAAPTAEGASEPDARLDDPEFVAELAWVRGQIEASACVCCHSDIAPNGASNWTIDIEGNFMSTFRDYGLALGAGWVDSTSFGMYPPEDNNGFDRRYGFPSTDPDRMRAFFAAELEHRGFGAADFEDAPPFGGPLYQQLVYEPEACENGEGVDRDGTMRWTGGPARYVYVLEAGSDNPTVPPNLDRPAGTKWRIDVRYDDEPIESGEVVYGQLPTGLIQQIPASGGPSELVEGETYYLYVTRDVGIPITRCLFTY